MSSGALERITRGKRENGDREVVEGGRGGGG